MFSYISHYLYRNTFASEGHLLSGLRVLLLCIEYRGELALSKKEKLEINEFSFPNHPPCTFFFQTSCLIRFALYVLL